PDGDMTRAEAIAVVARLQKLDLSDKSSKIYKDTKADMWYNGAINAAFKEGYLLEKEGENVRPNDKITRAELAELISHIDKKNNAIAPFDDVKGHKFEAAINQAYGNGRIEGYPDGTFKPDNTITRAEVATMLNKLYDRYPDKNFIDANQNLVHNYKDMSYKGHWGYYELVEAYHSHTYLRLKDNMEEWKVIIK
ncbi:MAG: S-layer homology domain-containing protein, partial [Peptoniphilus lacrimalis]